MAVRPVDVQDGVRYNSAAVKSVTEHPLRQEFFKRLDDEPIDKLIKRLCFDKLPVRIRKKLRTSLAVVLRQLGLIDVARAILKRRGAS